MKLKKHYQILQDASFEKIERILKDIHYDEVNALSYFVAGLFNIDRCELFSKNRSNEVAMARWMLFYALWFSTHKTYKEISRITALEGIAYDISAIHTGIRKIQEMIENDESVKTKWILTKKFINLKHQ